MLPTAMPYTTPWRVASARRRHQCAGLRRRCGLAISYRLPRLARAPTGATGCLGHYLGILYEFLRVTTHARLMRRPWSASAAWDFVAALLASPARAGLVPTHRPAALHEA